MIDRRAALVFVLLVPGLAGAWSSALRAETACPEGNVLGDARIDASYDVYHSERLTDGRVAADGESGLSDRSALFTSVGYVVYELPRITRIDSIFLQADASGGYRISGSPDGERWQPLGEVPAAGGSGMTTRWATGFGLEARYLRVEPAGGDAQFSLGELAAYCGVPAPWPPRFEIAAGVVRDEAWARARERRLAIGKIAFGLLGGLIVVGVIAWRRRSTPPPRWVVRVLLGAVILGGACSWTNFGTFHGLNVWHHHELFHYVLGAKYFDENRYTLLYHCTETAEAEMGRRGFVERRVIRNLGTNELEPASSLLANPAPCRAAFSEARWSEFKDDVEFYRSRDYPGSWGAIFRDHGYNATPLWTMFGGALVSLDRMSQKPGLLATIDAVLYAGLLGMLLWAFGLEVTALAALIWGVGLPWQYDWTGGAFGRVPWLFLVVAALCLMRRSRAGPAGVSLATAALLRVFPALFAVGPGMRAIRDLLRGRRFEAGSRSLLLGGLLAVVLLVPLSAWSGGGFGAWFEFFGNLQKHADAPLGNDVGLPALFAWSPSNVQQQVLTGRLEEFADWEQGRRDTFAGRRPIYLGVALAVFGLFTAFVLRYARADWEAACAGTLLALSLSELACYYLIFVILLSPFGGGRPRTAALLVLTVVASQFVALADLSVDTLFFVQSLLFLAVSVAVFVELILGRRVDAPRRLRQ